MSLTNETAPAYRAIAVIALIQSVVTVGGTFFVGMMLKVRGYASNVPDSFFLPSALFVRRSGFTLLLIPLAWAILTALAAGKATAPGWLVPVLVVAGIAGIIAGICGYVYLGLNPTVL